MMTLGGRHLKQKLIHSQKIMDVSDVQVSHKDGSRFRSNTIKASSKIGKERIWTLDSQFANKIVTEQIWIICVTKERVISVRICILSSAREMSQVACGHP